VERSKVRKLIGIGCAAAVIGAAFALAAPSIGSSPPEPAAPGTCVDFARDVDPKAVPVDSGYDPEKNLVYAHHAGRTYVLRPADPACQTLSSARGVIEDAIGSDRENEKISCRELSDAVAEGRTDMAGRRFDREAAQRYLAQRCGSGE
jgi:hypothetical protein